MPHAPSIAGTPPPLPSETTAIRYETTRGDLLYANIRGLCRSRFLQALWLLLIAWQCWASLQGPAVIHHRAAYKVVFVLVTGGLFYALLFGLTVAVTTVLVLVRKYRGVLGVHTLVLRNDGILETTAWNESLHRWAAYDHTISTRRYLILYVTDVMYFIVSKRRPLLEGNLEAFEAALRDRVSVSRQRGGA